MNRAFSLLCFITSLGRLQAQTADTVIVSSPSDSVHVVTRVDTVRAAIPQDTISIIGVGDVMMGSNYPDSTTLPPDSGKYLMAAVSDVLRGADVTMGNLEGVLLDSGGTAKECRDPKVCYVFRMPVYYVNNLVKAGFDVMSLANNHAGDFGNTGRWSSIKTLARAGIAAGGQADMPYSFFRRDRVTFAFASFAPNSGCLSIHDIPRAQQLVRNLKAYSDIVIISFHGGGEGKDYQHVPRKNEIFYGEDRGDVYAFAHAMIDAGADVVFGQGPHVPRAMEVYKNRFIAYSLGNFCTHGRINISGVSGLSPIVKVYVLHDGTFISGRIIAAYQSYEDGVQPDPDGRVIQDIRELTEKDFPESNLHIGDDGLITYLQTR